VFTILAVLALIFGTFRDVMFYYVIVINTLIGIVQELRAKKELDSLTLVSTPKAVAIRDGKSVTVNVSELVRDDVVVFSAGSQICADALVLSGEAQLNEALVTGESDEISKTAGSNLLSGSFVVSGEVRARLVSVGADSFASRLTLDAKKSKRASQSEMMRSLTKLIRVIGIIIIPVGLILIWNQHFNLGLDIAASVLKTVGALVGMIPEGLYLLTSIALTVSVVRLAGKRTLTHDLACIETLARVDVLCVDKTGTITVPDMDVEQVVALCPDRFNDDDIRMIMSDHAANQSRDNETIKAISRYFGDDSGRKAERSIPFSSSTKYSGAVYEEGETYLVGAPEILLGELYDEYREIIEPYTRSGRRVLLLVMYDADPGPGLPDGRLSMPIALILLTNRLRDNAIETFTFFREQGVKIKVISGDNPLTVSDIAAKAGIEGAEEWIDARELTTKAKLKNAAEKYTVFGRVTPEQKRKLVIALHQAGHTVAMTGDGVNDVLALKEADCSVAMASGSEVACQVSHLVLLDSDFSSMPSVVMEGRRVINNIERSAALYLVKNVFSFVMAMLSLAAGFTYPLEATQLSLVSTVTIGVPSFFLALESNSSIVTGRFLRNVLARAFPAGLAYVAVVLGIIAFGSAFTLEGSQVSTICAIALGITGLVMVWRTCVPMTRMRRALCVLLVLMMIFCVVFMKGWFKLEPLETGSILILAVFGLLSWPVMDWFYRIYEAASKLILSARDRRRKTRGRVL